MLFSQAYAGAKKPVISFELFPPKTPEAMAQLRSALPELAELKPDFITVTYGALGSTREKTFEIASLVQKELKIPSASHLTCVGSSRAELKTMILSLAAAGIRNIVALRGDPPKGDAEFRPAADGLSHGAELVAFIREVEKEKGLKPFGIAVAGYPEKHLEAKSLNKDIEFLKRKVDAGADLVITQLFYDNAVYFKFAELVHKKGISVPIIPGLLPVLSVKQVRRITAMCGAKIPPRLNQALELAVDDEAAAQEIGVAHCAEQVEGLSKAGVPGVHFYVLNRAGHIKRIWKGVGLQ